MNLAKLRQKLPSSGPVTLGVDTPEGFKETVDQYGNLITPYIAARMAMISPQRIYVLIAQGKFTRIVVYGVVHISHRELERWQKSPRPVGRPRLGQGESRVNPDRVIETMRRQDPKENFEARKA